MNNKSAQVFPFGIIAVVLGWTIYKQFDFENLKFENPALAVVYILTFAMSVYFLVKNAKQK